MSYLDSFPDRPQPASPPVMTYDREETDPPVTEPQEPVALDQDTAKALLRHELARGGGR